VRTRALRIKSPDLLAAASLNRVRTNAATFDATVQESTRRPFDSVAADLRKCGDHCDSRLRMNYVSTRGQTPALRFSDAVATGLAPDGGLFLPETLPDLSGQIGRFEKLGYADLCFEFLRIFATDIPVETLRGLVAKSYTTFSHAEIAPLVSLSMPKRQGAF